MRVRGVSRAQATAAFRIVGLLLLGGVVLLRLPAALALLVSGVEAIRYPFGLDYGEGPILSQARLLISGQSIYHSLSRGPYTVANYPPLFQFLERSARPARGRHPGGRSQRLAGQHTAHRGHHWSGRLAR